MDGDGMGWVNVGDLSYMDLFCCIKMDMTGTVYDMLCNHNKVYQAC